MIEIKQRIPFGPADDPASQAPWPIPTAFSIDWLSKIFLPFQQARLAEVTAAIAGGTTRVEAARKQAIDSRTTIGEERDGLIFRSAAEQRLQTEMNSHAERQVFKRVVDIRNDLDKTVPPIIKTMHRASQSAQTLGARFFDRISCLSRFSAGLKNAELLALKASYAVFIRDMAPVEIARLAQNAIDDGGSNLQSIVLLDVLRCENFRRVKKDDRAFDNAKVLALIPVPEFDQAQALLAQVVDGYNQALAAWVHFTGNTARASNMRMSHALGKVSLQQANA